MRKHCKRILLYFHEVCKSENINICQLQYRGTHYCFSYEAYRSENFIRQLNILVFVLFLYDREEM